MRAHKMSLLDKLSTRSHKLQSLCTKIINDAMHVSSSVYELENHKMITTIITMWNDLIN